MTELVGTTAGNNSSEMRSPTVDFIGQQGCDGVLALLQHHQEVLLGLSVVHLHCELVVELGDALGVDVLQSAVQHEEDQVVNDSAVLSQVEKGFEALRLENFEVLVVDASHSIDHILPNFDGRWIGFWISAQYISKIDVQHFP